MRRVIEALPFTSTAVALGLDSDGNASVLSSVGVDQSLLDELCISQGEGMIGRAAESGGCNFVFGRKQTVGALEEYDSTNRSSLDRMIGERGAPSLLAACPITDMKKTMGVLFMMVFGIDESQVDEWKRLLTLATGLYSLRLAVGRARVQPETPAIETLSLPRTIINQLNNHLSAVIGKAELALQTPDIGTEARQHMTRVMSEAEQAAAYIRENLESSTAEDVVERTSSLSASVERILSETHISGDLYMAGGRPREIQLRLSTEEDFDVDSEAVSKLIASALDRFGVQAADDDILTVATYHRENGVYLDISRHRKNFPPVDEVANFGRYENAGETLQHRPSDVFLRHVAGDPVSYAVERESDRPAYLSFKFPRRGPHDIRSAAATSAINLLAIDDHAVILDLISAMGQSLGYEVQTALLGGDGVRLARQKDYDIILTDLALPDISGLEVARQIREFATEVPIILVTGWEATLDRSQLSAAGIHKVLYKPFRIEQLTDIVRSAVSGIV
jgi:CheY-like chemotaxis protein